MGTRQKGLTVVRAGAVILAVPQEGGWLGRMTRTSAVVCAVQLARHVGSARHAVTETGSSRTALASCGESVSEQVSQEVAVGSGVGREVPLGLES